MFEKTGGSAVMGAFGSGLRVCLGGGVVVMGRRFFFGLIGAALAISALAASLAMAASPPVVDPTRQKVDFFESRIRPVLLSRCASCHTGAKAMGGLDLSSRAALLKGGKAGSAVDPAHPEQSLLLRAIRYSSDLKMPPAGKLSAREIADFERWLGDGAVWGSDAPGRKQPAGQGTVHWAFQPVVRAAIPSIPGSKSASRNPIDAFVVAQSGRPLAPAADRRTLIRRATFDLTGLPPQPEAVDAFVADRRPDAFARVVDRLLASPQYGERWGRHWLDVVRYADTAGETADFPAEHAWRYRNYVIDSFNADKRYDDFIREQLAGDLLAPEGPPEKYSERIVATGYLAIARRFGFDSDADHYLTLEDTIDTLGKSFLGLTLGCARCHDHKYDPIPTADYYALYGILSGARFANPGCEKNKSPRDMVAMTSPVEMERRMAPQRAALAEAEEALKKAEAAVAPAAAAARQRASLPAEASAKGEIPNGGAQSFGSETSGWMVRPGDFIQLSILPKNGHGADSTQIELEVEEVGGQGRRWNLVEDRLARFSQRDDRWPVFDLVPGPTPFTQFIRDAETTPGLLVWRGPGDTPSAFANPSDKALKFITVTLPPRSVALHPGPQGGVAVAWVSPISGRVRVRGRVADADATGGDGIAWMLEQRPGFGPELAAMFDAAAARNQARKKRDELAAQPPAVDYAYAVTEGKPGDVRLQKRGNPEDLGDMVPRRFLTVFGGQRLPESTKESGRRELAEWIASPKNPLTGRVIVNRVWQHHFGVGLVSTPNDFGARGELPTNPKLLDWLASSFTTETRRHGEGGTARPSDGANGLGWSLKALHRVIMLSATYQQASDAPSKALSGSPRLVQNPMFKARRLEAEEIRDSMLAVSGELDLTPGGPHPFPPAGQRNFTQHGPFNAVYENNKRGVYLMVQRIRRHPFLALFDGADPNASTPVRGESTVPTQALFFMNSPFAHARALAFADRLLKEAPDDTARVDRACRLLFGRPATAEDQSEASRFLSGYSAKLTGGDAAEKQRQAWAAYARVLFGANEFLFVE